MGRKVIKDRNSRVLGYIETMPDGRQKALNANFRTLGYYDPRRDVTADANFRTLARGNVLSALVYDAD
ncbi:hypothetical protein [Microvirga sp. BSC39]|uniref:hypothetical protein n=1 Tax=Microvirga sp. BSC39 TaxID=1549810 RepID=UPI0004E942A3|nr:hypothetical protein [Microvirga sp. BSC39]KFG70907.1 hypothetical protein JH26_01285 [Microvirga sp. BSC39]